MEGSSVVHEAVRITNMFVVKELDKDIDTVLEIIKKGRNITEVDIQVAKDKVRSMNRLIMILVGGDSELYEAERYHLFLDSDGWLCLVKGIELQLEEF
jgi:hypothetical protein